LTRVLVIYEGATERAFHRILQEDLRRRYDRENITDRVGFTSRAWLDELKDDRKLCRRVHRTLDVDGCAAIVAVVDLFPRFTRQGCSSQQAREHLERQVSRPNEFFAHVACHDFEAWLLPFWLKILRRIRCQDKKRPGAEPEKVNGTTPPSYHLKQLYRTSGNPAIQQYEKVTETQAILAGESLETIAAECPEFKAFLNTILKLAGLTQLS
jgi:hypothetical protein